MRKKLFKYIKFIVSMVLILGLIAPSYASLSASDGSAFVTKAEFDSALADFNSRLTTFEAGINSKIDSQVTSYLDRNGIWNGKEIDLTDNDADNTGTFWFPVWKDLWNKNNMTYWTDEDDLVLKGGSKLEDCDTFVNVLGLFFLGTSLKSGLFVGSIIFTQADDIVSNRWMFLAGKFGTCNLIYDINIGVDVKSVLYPVLWRRGDPARVTPEPFQQDVVKDVRWSTIITSGSFGDTTNTRMGMYYGVPTYNVIFFISKGEKIYLDTKLKCWAGNGGMGIQRANSWGGTNPNRPRFVLSDPKVY